MDKIGRRKAIIISNILPIICWGLTYSVTDSIWPLYVARTIGGAGSGKYFFFIIFFNITNRE